MKLYVNEIDVESTHILLKSDINRDVAPIIRRQRKIIEEHIAENPDFTGFTPTEIIEKPKILNMMTHAGRVSKTGPMASVAGSISQICLEYLDNYKTKYSIIENGGDIALKTFRKSIIEVYAGESPFSGKIGLNVKAKKNGYGICTSSGTFGHSKSFGKTDATIVLCKEASIADGLATQIANHGIGEDDESVVNNSLEKAEECREYFDGAIVIKGEYLAKIGHIPKIVGIQED